RRHAVRQERSGHLQGEAVRRQGRRDLAARARRSGQGAGETHVNVTALFRYLPLILIAIAWEASSRLGLVSQLALPPLSAVIAAWVDLVQSGELVTNGLASIYRGGAGLVLSIVIGASLGVLMAWWRPLHVVLNPLVELFYPMPKSALIPVTVIWLGFGDGSK